MNFHAATSLRDTVAKGLRYLWLSLILERKFIVELLCGFRDDTLGQCTCYLFLRLCLW